MFPISNYYFRLDNGARGWLIGSSGGLSPTKSWIMLSRQFCAQPNRVVSCAQQTLSTLATQPQIEVYTDGNCNLCRWSREHVEPLDRDQKLEWLDYNQPEILKRAAPHTAKEMAEEMHVRPADGHWYKGYFAWIEIVRVLPRWKWLAPVMGVWPFTKLGPIFYHWLASHRYTLFGVPPPCDETGVCKLHK